MHRFIIVLLFILVAARGMDISSSAAARNLTLTHTTHLIHAGQRPEPVFADPARHRVYIGYEHSGYVAVIDDRTDQVLKTIRTGKEVEDLAFDAGASRLYVANRTSNSVSVIDTLGLRLTRTISTPGPAGIAVDPALKHLYVASAKAIAVIDTQTGRRLFRAATPGSPQAAGVDPATHQVFIALQKANALLVMDGSSFKTVTTIAVGQLPVHPIRVDSRRHRVYVVNSGSSSLSVIDSRTLRAVKSIPTGAHPEGLWIEPSTHRAFVSNEGDPGTDKNHGHTVSVIDLRSGHTIATLPTLLGPEGVAYDRATGKVYVDDENSGAVSVITF